MPHMKEQVPLPGIYDPDFIAANQDTRADNIIKGTRSEQVEQVRQQIRTFKEEQKVDKVSKSTILVSHVVQVAVRLSRAQSRKGNWWHLGSMQGLDIMSKTSKTIARWTLVAFCALCMHPCSLSLGVFSWLCY